MPLTEREVIGQRSVDEYGNVSVRRDTVVNSSAEATGAVTADGWTLAGVSNLAARPRANTTYAEIFQSSSGVAGYALGAGQFLTGASVDIDVSFWYRI